MLVLYSTFEIYGKVSIQIIEELLHMPELQSLDQEPEKRMGLFGAISMGDRRNDRRWALCHDGHGNFLCKIRHRIFFFISRYRRFVNRLFIR